MRPRHLKTSRSKAVAGLVGLVGVVGVMNTHCLQGMNVIPA
jgi:hypothetical protein